MFDRMSPPVRTRLKVYEEETAPLVEYYLERGLLRRVDGEGTIDEIQARVQGVTDPVAGANG